MKRIILSTVGVALIAFVAATVGSARPHDQRPREARREGGVLPKLPAEIANRKRLIVGVKCDTPPFGYLDVRGKNSGVDVEIAKWLARYAFGREQRLTFVCAPTAVREPLLTTTASTSSSRRSRTPPTGTRGSTSPARTTRRPAGCW